MVEEPVDLEEMDGQFPTTYQPSIFEKTWLYTYLRPFYDAHLITDVEALVKGGKEANVYRCTADASTGYARLAAKVYRPQMFRAIRNDALYREGRQILTAAGRPLKGNDHRVIRAMGKKSAFGEQVAHTSWLMHEYRTLQTLYAAGAAVPHPIAVADNAILMSYLGDTVIGAPTLNDVALEAAEAEPLFAEVLRNIRTMLQHHLIHGDLSAYNILYWDGAVTFIDFPQVVDSRTNSRAQSILRRDVERICQYFGKYGIAPDAVRLANELWRAYAGVDSTDRLADLSRFMEAD